jgi:hypothetical protein
MDYENEEYESNEYVPLNWDTLIKNKEVFSVIKDEMNKKFSAECLMDIITAAKEQGMKDKDIFLPKPKVEMVSLFEDSVGNSLED